MWPGAAPTSPRQNEGCFPQCVGNEAARASVWFNPEPQQELPRNPQKPPLAEPTTCRVVGHCHTGAPPSPVRHMHAHNGSAAKRRPRPAAESRPAPDKRTTTHNAREERSGPRPAAPHAQSAPRAMPRQGEAAHNDSWPRANPISTHRRQFLRRAARPCYMLDPSCCSCSTRWRELGAMVRGCAHCNIDWHAPATQYEE